MQPAASHFLILCAQKSKGTHCIFIMTFHKLKLKVGKPQFLFVPPQTLANFKHFTGSPALEIRQ